MTVFTNSKSEKKADVEVPLHTNANSQIQDPLATAVSNPNTRVSKWKSLWRLLSVIAASVCIVILSLSIGMAFGRLYKHYLLAQRDLCPRYMSFSCSANIPFDPKKLKFIEKEYDFIGSLGGIFNSFKQNFELDVEARRYEMISVPYKNQRRATFIHDFDTNMTAIVDEKHGRCFLLPLNRCEVLAPNVMFSIVHKTLHGFPIDNVDVVTKTLHAVIPAVVDRKRLSCYIADQCAGRPIYKLVKCDRNKTSLPYDAKFAEYAGTGIINYKINNYKSVERYEENVSD